MDKLLAGFIAIITLGLIDQHVKGTQEIQEEEFRQREKDREERQGWAILLFIFGIILVLFALFTGDSQPLLTFIGIFSGIGSLIIYPWE